MIMVEVEFLYKYLLIPYLTGIKGQSVLNKHYNKIEHVKKIYNGSVIAFGNKVYSSKEIRKFVSKVI